MSRTITDGTVVFAVRDKRMQMLVDFSFRSVLFSSETMTTSRRSSIMAGGKRSQKAECCKVLGGVVNGKIGEEIEAGLPNITGQFAVLQLVIMLMNFHLTKAHLVQKILH